MLISIKSRRQYNNDVFKKYTDEPYEKIQVEKNRIFMEINKRSGKEFLAKLLLSEHYDLFVAIAKSNIKVRNILEIGTYQGHTASYLSLLFPQARITTIDLPHNSTKFIDTYDRDKNHLEFVRERNELLQNFKNIQAKEIESSKFLLLSKGEITYDLIWIDGDHSYPQVSIDIIGSLHLLSSNGIVMVDDVYKFDTDLEENYRKSVGAFQTIENLSESKVIKKDYIHKRTVGIQKEGKPYELGKYKKSIGIIQKNETVENSQKSTVI